MAQDINIVHVSVKTSSNNYDLLTLHQFLKLPAQKRYDLIKNRQIEFLDINGDKINLLEGMKAITLLIKQLREEGEYSKYISKDEVGL